MMKKRILALCALGGALAVGASAAQAQYYERPPGGIGGAQTYPAQAPDSSGLTLRVDRLENQVRSLNGQIEQMQNQMQKLQEQLRKFQQDVDFRFDERSKPTGKPQRHTDATDEIAPPQDKVVVASRDDAPVQPGPRRGDAFVPSETPGAPGAPLQLGTPGTASRPLAGTSGLRANNRDDIIVDDDDASLDDAPLNLDPRNAARRSTPRPQSAAVDPGAPPALPRILPPLPQQQGSPPMQAPANAVAALPPAAGPRAEYDVAVIALKNGQYEDAQSGFESFLRKYPKDHLASEAVFNLGESFARRGRNREAAEQYLKLSTDYASTARAPESMVKLGVSLEKLGLKEQACATFSEVGRKYPKASPALRATADREQKRNQC